MLRKIVSVLVAVVLLCSASLVSSAEILDPARTNPRTKDLGYDLDSMKTKEEVLENGDIKIWYIDDSNSIDNICKRAETDENLKQLIKDTIHMYGSEGILPHEYALYDGLWVIDTAWAEGVPYYHSGDVNLDLRINLKDVLALRKHLANLEVLDDLSEADCDENGTIDLADVLSLRKRLAKLDKRDK